MVHWVRHDEGSSCCWWWWWWQARELVLTFCSLCSFFVLFSRSTVVHLSVTTIQNIRLIFEVRHFNWLTSASFVFSMAAWFVLIVFFAYVPSISYGMSSSEVNIQISACNLFWSIFFVSQNKKLILCCFHLSSFFFLQAIGLDRQMFGDASAWLTVLLSIVVSLLPAFLMKVYDNVYAPKLNQIALELQRKHYAELRPRQEYWFACLCCGKGAFANVPVDGEEPLISKGEAVGDGLELTSIGQKNEGKDYKNPMGKKSEQTLADSKDVQVFKELRQRLKKQ